MAAGGGYHGFPIGMNLVIFDLQVTVILHTKFQINWPLVSREESQHRFSRWQLWQPSWTSDGKDFIYFRSTNCPDTSYQVSSQLVFQFMRRSSKLIFSRWPPWSSWISYQNDFSYFYSACHPDISYQVSSQVAFWFRRKSSK